MSTVSESIARPVRTAAHGSAAWVVTEGVDAFWVNLDERQYGVLIVGLTMFFSFLQAAIENGLGKALLRDMPPTDVAVVDDGGPGGV